MIASPTFKSVALFCFQRIDIHDVFTAPETVNDSFERNFSYLIPLIYFCDMNHNVKCHAYNKNCRQSQGKAAIFST